MPEIALRPEDAAQALGVSRDFFDERIAPEVAVIDLGRVKLYPVDALREWAQRSCQIPTGR